MKSLPILSAVGAFAIAVASSPLAGADTGDDAACRVVVVPAHVREVTKTIVEEPVTCERQVPRYKTVELPVYETRRIPEYKMITQPVYETREIPVFRAERIPVWGDKEVPAYKAVRKPVTLTIPNPFGCEDPCLELWDRCEQVPDGTKTVRAIVAHETREVQCGTRLERHQVGTREERVLSGYRTEKVQVGTRTERRLDGYDTETVVAKAAQQRVVTERTHVACEQITVVPDGSPRDVPLEGTSRVLTESQLQDVLADVR